MDYCLFYQKLILSKVFSALPGTPTEVTTENTKVTCSLYNESETDLNLDEKSKSFAMSNSNFEFELASPWQRS